MSFPRTVTVAPRSCSMLSVEAGAGTLRVGADVLVGGRVALGRGASVSVLCGSVGALVGATVGGSMVKVGVAVKVEVAV